MPAPYGSLAIPNPSRYSSPSSRTSEKAAPKSPTDSSDSENKTSRVSSRLRQAYVAAGSAHPSLCALCAPVVRVSETTNLSSGHHKKQCLSLKRPQQSQHSNPPVVHFSITPSLHHSITSPPHPLPHGHQTIWLTTFRQRTR